MPKYPGPLAPRFWSKVARSDDPDACWEWQRSCYPDGYGQFKIAGRNCRAPRVAYTLARGPIPDGLQVLHTCDNPLCCNPAHLFLGTVQDNVDDKIAKGRDARGDRNGGRTRPERVRRGELNGRAKLTAAQVREIRERVAAGGVTRADLAAEYGVTDSLVSMIARGEIWRGV